MQSPTLIKTFKAGAAITKHRIVKHDTADDTLIQGAAATDKLLGVADALGAAAAADRVDVILAGTARVEFGGTVARGDLLTSDANGKAVAAAPSAGSNNRVIGVALVSGVSGDIGFVQISQGSVQG